MTTHIQINDIAPLIRYRADGTQSAFSFPFAIFATDDLEVWLNGERMKAGYSVLGAGVTTGGTVLFTTPPAAATPVLLRRRLSLRRTTDYQADGIIRAKTLNDELDYQTAALQQVAEDISRAVKRAPYAEPGTDLTLPEPAPGTAIGWNGDGTALVNDPADFATTRAQASANAAVAGEKAAAAAISAATAAQHAEIATSGAAQASALALDAGSSARTAAESASRLAALTDGTAGYAASAAISAGRAANSATAAAAQYRVNANTRWADYRTAHPGAIDLGGLSVAGPFADEAIPGMRIDLAQGATTTDLGGL